MGFFYPIVYGSTEKSFSLTSHPFSFRLRQMYIDSQKNWKIIPILNFSGWHNIKRSFPKRDFRKVTRMRRLTNKTSQQADLWCPKILKSISVSGEGFLNEPRLRYDFFHSEHSDLKLIVHLHESINPIRTSLFEHI